MPTQRKNRQQRSAPPVDAPTGPDNFLDVVLGTTSCGAHDGPAKTIWEPCFSAEGLTDREIFGVCNYRAKRAGFNHPISPEAMSGRR